MDVSAIDWAAWLDAMWKTVDTWQEVWISNAKALLQAVGAIDLEQNFLRFVLALGTILVVFLLIRALLGISRLVLGKLARTSETHLELIAAEAGNARTLVVAVHGLAGCDAFQGALNLVRDVLPGADRLIVRYPPGYTVNADPYEIADVIEQRIHAEYQRGQYDRIVLFGYSAGAALLRKSWVWACGEEDDRTAHGLRGRREWVDKVERFVLLAGMNRGWSMSPRPRNMDDVRYAVILIAQWIASTFRIGGLVMALRRGAPFIADTRVQWIRVARSDEVVEGRRPFPQVIQLLGSQDDIVSREDGQDLATAAGSVFRTMPQTSHESIAAALYGDGGEHVRERRRLIELALLGRIDELEPDQVLMEENREVSRLVYVMHGIRDFGHWTDRIRAEIESRCEVAKEKVDVFNARYGYFPMARFLLYSDRQRNVRDFMDLYTENLARYPNAVSVDYVGHSNGTYILGSAMQRYATLRVRRVFFAGSVMPNDYPWAGLVRQQRVKRVINVVATADWVVGWFPNLFEQMAGLLGLRTRGHLDLGGAGFNGFRDSGVTDEVDDMKFCAGGHSTGVDVTAPAKLEAICRYVVDDDDSGLRAFGGSASQDGKVKLLSHLSPVVWVTLLAVALLVGLLLFTLVSLAGPTIAYAVLVLYIGLLLAVLYLV